jgi:uncharacterized membrane protein (DUF485 family)
MSQEIYEKILRDSEFQNLVSDRMTFSWTLSGLILASYYAFILVIAFFPHWLGQPISGNSVITWGIPVGVFLIVFSMVLTAIYVVRCNGVYDDRVSKIISRFDA